MSVRTETSTRVMLDGGDGGAVLVFAPQPGGKIAVSFELDGERAGPSILVAQSDMAATVTQLKQAIAAIA